jgi:MFS transporter, CP family, cyanate transporter
VPFLADRGGSRRQWLTLCAGALLVATIGIAALPGGGFAWAILAGLGIGATFPLSMTLPLDVARDPADTGAVVGLMLGAGYTITAVGPILLGAVRDATGSFSASLWVLVAVAAGFVASVLPLSPARLRPADRQRVKAEAMVR